MAALARCAGASLGHYRVGQTLIRVGERDFKFFVVKSGEIEILDESGETPPTLAVLGRGEFTGDVAGRAGGHRSCWRRAAPACSPPVMCGPARSSASPRPWVRARWRSRSCTNT
jgi:CRP-like cAMP-binding protein